MAPPARSPEHREAESPGVVFLGFKKIISIKILHFTSKSLLRTYYYVLSVGDIEERKRGVAKVNKDRDHYPGDPTFSSMWVGTVGRSDGTGGRRWLGRDEG